MCNVKAIIFGLNLIRFLKDFQISFLHEVFLRHSKIHPKKKKMEVEK